MNSTEMDKAMRVYEESLDQVILPETFMVARLDGRSFTRLTKEICSFEAPYDEKFRDHMIVAVKHLMESGFRIVYAYTESDEISLLFHPGEHAFGRKVRKYNSILASEASASFTLSIGTTAAFDCRMVPLPTLERVQDYFLWRQDDAHRNCLNSHCYWLLRHEGLSSGKATAQLKGKSTSFKNELLFSHGVNYDELPSWQKRGLGIYWEEYERSGLNPMTGESETAIRTRLIVDYELPLKEEYAQMIAGFLPQNTCG